MQKTITRNLLKFSAGRSICCPSCGQIADYRRWVIYTSPAGQTGANCADCWRKGLALIHDDKPHAYLLSIGWQIDTLVNFDKPARKSRAKPQPLKTQAQRAKDALAGHKAIGHIAKKDRVFPPIVHRADAPLTINDDGEWSSPVITAEYVARYCEANHLTQEVK